MALIFIGVFFELQNGFKLMFLSGDDKLIPNDQSILECFIFIDTESIFP